MESDRITIYDYEDPRSFLKDCIESKRKKRSSYSMREFSKRVGFRSSGMLSMFLSGKRQLSIDSAERVADTLKLKWKEKQYFFLLIRKTQAKSTVEKNQIQNLILKTKFRTTKNILGSKQYRFLSEWYYPVIYLMIGDAASQKTIKTYPETLGRGLTLDKVQQAIEDMCDLQLLECSAGVYRQKHAHLSTEDDIQEPASFLFLSKMMELAKEAFDLPAEEREFGAVTLNIPPQEWPWLKERIREFRQEVADHLGHQKHSGQVYQINIQAFPLVKENTEKTE